MATYTKTVDPNGGADYASIALWEAGEQSLYTSGDIAVADCLRTGATKDTTYVTISGWTAGVIPQVIVNSSYRHEGIPADTRASDGNYIYTLEFSLGSNHGFLILDSDVTVDGLILTGATGQTLIQTEGAASTGSEVYNNILHGHAPSSVRAALRYIAGASHLAYNNIVYNNANQGIEFGSSSGTLTAYNNTVFGGDYDGIRRTGGTLTAVNNLSFDNAASDYFGAFTSSSNNVSSDTTAPGTTPAISKTAYGTYFTDHTTGDFHLTDTSLALFGIASVDQSATFTTDAEGTARTASTAFGLGALLLEATGISITSNVVNTNYTSLDPVIDFTGLIDITESVNNTNYTALDPTIDFTGLVDITESVNNTNYTATSATVTLSAGVLINESVTNTNYATLDPSIVLTGIISITANVNNTNYNSLDPAIDFTGLVEITESLNNTNYNTLDPTVTLTTVNIEIDEQTVSVQYTANDATILLTPEPLGIVSTVCFPGSITDLIYNGIEISLSYSGISENIEINGTITDLELNGTINTACNTGTIENC